MYFSNIQCYTDYLLDFVKFQMYTTKLAALLSISVVYLSVKN